MSGYWSLNAEIDRPTGTFNILINYYVDPYIDPETSEYFGSTTWVIDYSITGGPVIGGNSGFGTENTLALSGVGLDSSLGVHAYVIDFHATNDFSGQGIAATWNVFTAAYDTTPQSLLGSAIDDILIGGAGADALRGFDGADLVDTGAGDDIVDGGSGDDWLNGLDGDDILIGGTGDDIVWVDSAGDTVIERAGEGYDRVIALASFTLAGNVEGLTLDGFANLNGTGNTGNNLIFGNAGANMLTGLDGDDILNGNGGDDVLWGGPGADELAGRDNGTALGDTATYTDTSVGIVANLATGLGSGGAAQGDTYIEVENIDGSQGADTLIGDTGGNILLGFGGVDILNGNGGDDVLDGGQGTDILNGNDGDDVLRGGQGADELAGGGNGTALGDTATYTETNVGIVANLATGLGSGGAAQGDTYIEVENVDGSQGADILIGSTVGNHLLGFGGDDVLRGGDGADTLDGGAGTDTASYYTGSVGVSVSLATGSASYVEAQDDSLTGIENLSGSQGNDSLIGNGTANTLQGWNGDDILTGADGKDTLVGGAGADRFAYTTSADSAVGANADRITDFSHAHGDRIDLSAIDADTGADGDQAFSFIGTALYNGVAGQLRYVSNGTITTIAGDLNGDGTSDFHIQLTGAIGVVAGDFIL